MNAIVHPHARIYIYEININQQSQHIRRERIASTGSLWLTDRSVEYQVDESHPCFTDCSCLSRVEIGSTTERTGFAALVEKMLRTLWKFWMLCRGKASRMDLHKLLYFDRNLAASSVTVFLAVIFLKEWSSCINSFVDTGHWESRSFVFGGCKERRWQTWWVCCMLMYDLKFLQNGDSSDIPTSKTEPDDVKRWLMQLKFSTLSLVSWDPSLEL